MSGSVYALLPQLANIMRTFNQLGAQHTSRLLSQLHQYGDLTDGQIGWMRLKAGAILTTAFLSGATGIAAGFFPKGASSPTLNLESGSSPVEAMFNSIANKLQDNEFMRTALKAASKNIHEFGNGSNLLFDMPTTEIEAKRTIMTQVRFQSAQDGQNSAQGAIDKANQLANSIIEKKGRGA
ncbi:MAG: hypothetical protein JSR93_07045 [Verrucomicrobia bacterium]|nr:hypothetical protein [Verrucomicrobiota bacterium]